MGGERAEPAADPRQTPLVLHRAAARGLRQDHRAADAEPGQPTPNVRAAEGAAAADEHRGGEPRGDREVLRENTEAPEPRGKALGSVQCQRALPRGSNPLDRHK